MRSQGDNTKTITVALVKQYVLQHELNSHGLIVDALKNLLITVEVNHAIVVVKNLKAQQEWKRITSKMDVWKRSFNPSPLPNF